MSSLSPTRLRRRSFLNDPPGYSPNLPGHSILLNCPSREKDRSPSPAATAASASSHGHDHGHAEADAIAAKAASGTVSFAPLPVIPPELKRRSSITLGVAARKNLLSSPEDEIYPDPKKNKPPERAANGGVRAVYMSDADWEEYKRQHEQKNGNEVVDIGELVTAGAKNLWRRVKPPQKEGGTGAGTSPVPVPGGTSPSPSTTSSSLLSTITSPRLGSSPGSSSSFLGSFTAPKLSIRRRSDPGAASTVANNPATKSPDLPNVVEEESLSRRESAEPLGTVTAKVPAPAHAVPASPTSPKYMDWEQKPRSVSIDSGHVPQVPPESVSPPSIKSPHGPPSPPPRVQDILPSEDEIHDKAAEPESSGNEDDDYHDAEDDGTLGLERVDIQSDAGHGHADRQADYRTGRDSAVLGFDRSRFNGE